MSRALLHTPIRRAHLIAPFGPGALLLTRNRVSAITCAPATWMRSLPSRAPGSVSVLDELTITDRHLQAYCGVNRFIVPWTPSSDDPNKDVDWLVPAARFPLAEYCANPDCQRLIYRPLADANEGRCTACARPGAQRGRWPTFQVPVVLACQAGHLTDVPWPEWLHRFPGASCDRQDVRYRPGAAADRPSLRCGSCKRTATFGPDTTFPCTGQRPWLPHADPEPCILMARPVERTSTTAYYPCQLSSLTIPVAGADNPLLSHALTDNAVLRALRALPRAIALKEMVAATARIGIKTDEAELSRHLDALEQPPETGPRRADELSALTSTSHPRRPRAALPDLVVEPQDVAAYRGTLLGDRLAAVSLVPRLRETRVLAGFSRIEPTPADPDAGYRQLWGKPRPERFAQHATDDWLPGYQVFGEGILLVLDPDAVTAWEAKATGNARLRAAAAGVVHQLGASPAAAMAPRAYPGAPDHAGSRTASRLPAASAPRANLRHRPENRGAHLHRGRRRPGHSRRSGRAGQPGPAQPDPGGNSRSRLVVRNRPGMRRRQLRPAREGKHPRSMPPLPAPARDML